MSLNIFEIAVNTKHLFLEVCHRGRISIEWMLMKLSRLQGVEDGLNMYWTLLWALIVFLLIAVFCWQFGRTKVKRISNAWSHALIADIRKNLTKDVHEVHHVSGSLDSTTESITRCIGILNQSPSLINHPRPPHNYTPFLRACWSGNATLVRYMLLNGADINSSTINKETPIYLASYRIIKSKKWNPSILNLLYNAGCPLSVPNAKGITALHYAAHAGHATLTRWLLMHGAHLSLPPCKTTPYDHAIRFQDINHKSVAVLLHLYCPEMAEKELKNCPEMAEKELKKLSEQ